MCPWMSAVMSWPLRRTPRSSIHKVIVVTNAPDTRLDLCTLLTEALVLATGRVERLLSLL